MTYDRLLRHVFDDLDTRLKPAGYVVRERPDHERSQVVAANGRAAARAMLDLLNDLPTKIGAGSEAAFVVGFEPIDHRLLPSAATEAITTWQALKSFLYSNAIDLRLEDGPSDVQLAFASRFADIVTKELDAFLTSRLIFWKPELEDQRWR